MLWGLPKTTPPELRATRKAGEFKGHFQGLQRDSGFIQIFEAIRFFPASAEPFTTAPSPYNAAMIAITSNPPTDCPTRGFSPVDLLIGGFDRALRTVAAVHQSRRPNPGAELPESVVASHDRRQVCALMRINHAGEVAAQALYHGQALTARSAQIRQSMLDAAADETDHLAWCSERIDELGGRRSLLNPLWYAGSFAIGAIAGLSGDRTSLGFVAETEKQVAAHLSTHLQALPVDDARSRAIVKQMGHDEALHGAHATAAGGVDLPMPIRSLMRFTAKLMTRSAYWV